MRHDGALQGPLAAKVTQRCQCSITASYNVSMTFGK
jgi:hypothetical protein